MRKNLLTSAVVMALVSPAVWATNGMHMEGYGARSSAMGGAGMALDAGNSAVMLNPATLTELDDGDKRLGLGLTILGPDVSSKMPAFGVGTDSDGTAYYMPTLSYIQRSGNLVYGAALMAQGGMGTEYGRAGQGDLFSGGMSMMQQFAPLSGEEIRSEVGVGRVMFPLAFEVNDRLSVAAQLDYVWAGMDLQMDLDGNSFGDFADPSRQNMGTASGSMVNGFFQLIGMGAIADVNWARFDFSDDNDFTGQAFGTGFGYKLGFTYDVSDTLKIGGTYHSRTNIADLETNEATVGFNIDMNTAQGPANMTVGVDGKITVVDFQWPEVVGLGMAWQPTDQWTIAADVKQLNWSGVLDDFKMTFEAFGSQSNPVAQGFAGASMDVVLYQGWEDQVVLSLGAEYKMSDKLALRAGYSDSNNPVPNEFVNPLFPATIENHWHGGFGYKMSDSSKLGFALVFAPEVDVTNSMSGIQTTHSQLTWRFNYVHTF